jgi:hypothetical protein
MPEIMTGKRSPIPRQALPKRTARRLQKYRAIAKEIQNRAAVEIADMTKANITSFIASHRDISPFDIGCCDAQ